MPRGDAQPSGQASWENGAPLPVVTGFGYPDKRRRRGVGTAGVAVALAPPGARGGLGLNQARKKPWEEGAYELSDQATTRSQLVRAVEPQRPRSRPIQRPSQGFSLASLSALLQARPRGRFREKRKLPPPGSRPFQYRPR